MEENVHLARSLARDKLDKYSLEQMVGGPPSSLGHIEGEFVCMQVVQCFTANVIFLPHPP